MKHLVWYGLLLLFSLAAFASPKIHKSISGVEYTQDESIPQLGEAYRDPEGLIWGSPLLENGNPAWVEYGEAYNYCERIGARLPHFFEFIKLRNDLSNPYYSPKTIDDTELMLPFLDTTYWVQHDGQTYWRFARGSISGSNQNPGNGKVRCVGGKIWDGKKNSGPLMISTEAIVKGGWPGLYCRNLATKCERLEGNSNCTDSLTYDDWRLPTPKELKLFFGMNGATASFLPTHSYNDDYLTAFRLTNGDQRYLRWKTSILYPNIEPMTVRCVR